MSEITFKKYNWQQQFRQHGVCALIASRGSGKSTLLKHILYELRTRFDVGIAFCGSAESVESMKNIIHPSFIFNSLDSDELVDRLEQVVDEQEKLASIKKHRNLAIILEDVADDRKFMRSNAALKRIASRGRHANITLFFTSQYSSQVPPDIRTNLDCAVILRPAGEERELIRKSFFSMLPQRQFNTIIDVLCVDFRSIVLDTTNQSSEINKQIYTCKGKTMQRSFQLLSPTYKAIASRIALSESQIMENEERARQVRRAERERRSAKRSLIQPKSKKEGVVILS